VRTAGQTKRRIAAATALVALSIAGTAQAAAPDRVAPLYETRGAIADQYIVTLEGSLPAKPTKRSERAASTEARRVASSVNATPDYVYDSAIKGFAADLTRVQVRRLRHSAQVKYVEQDARVQLSATQIHAPWHLDRIDQRALPLSHTYEHSASGAGVHAFIIDTGLQSHHPDFTHRAHNGYDALQGDGSDCHGHGTHVAGIIGGDKYGVAKHVKLIGVRVLGCSGSGTHSATIAGVNWVAAHHLAGKSVANLSLGGGVSPSVDDAVSKLIHSGVFVSVAAGNSNANACNYSPARVPAAFTTAASDSTDAKASFSNFGPCVDGYAPGAGIISDWTASTTRLESGTSMAAPMVAGTAALYLSHHAGTPHTIDRWLKEHATPGVIRNNPLDTANLLLYKAGL